MMDEYLFLYSTLLWEGLLDMAEYNQWLDEIFIKNLESEILIDLEFCCGDLNKTIAAIHNYLSDKLSKLDYDTVGELLIGELKKQYDKEGCDIADLAAKAYQIWEILPGNIGREEPFFRLAYIDDPISYGDEKQTRDLFEGLFCYYEKF